ncbi:putative 3-beta hydroxysteroid dehydrogenase protein [Phaeoacremonium minimum UCRPA7]|uniref:Putative 3-beta hydroxysteroid dehydrogenase protein n=1 Tax=Phaeoacremonium minimum (strain UCR-PA7) TaxID=1286976 RepID=R8BLF9_PHAM7|nr:putative 3-beta hydroxysteroid dehydrogenase protein [Phaeoacremonium minimum UCRPA7]EOO00100.1 putative 3-beta hydroxysteroid dehydrogenase protein [Phaeoacremonium minimum UCRPA7]
MVATVLITGASGLIGFRILLAALEAGHKVRYTARSHEKAQLVASNPAVRKLAPGDRLVAAIISDLTADGAFDSALDGVTHVIHAGSPVPKPTFEPITEVFQPTIKMASGLLQSAIRSPSVRRVIITSSIVANAGLIPGPDTVTASTRIPPLNMNPDISSFGSAMEGYVAGKIVEMHNTDELVRTYKPHFTISHVVPGYVFGRNELALDATMMRTKNSSNNFLMFGMTGAELPFPIHDVFAHIDDVAETHLRVTFDEACVGKDYGIATKVDYASIFDHVEKAFPKAVEAGVFKRGTVHALPTAYDSSETQALLGGRVKGFESAVIDTAGQYLETLGIAKE